MNVFTRKSTGKMVKTILSKTSSNSLTVRLRRNLTGSVISSFRDFALVPGSVAHTHLSSFLSKNDEHGIEVDTSSSNSQAPTKLLSEELEIYCYYILLLFLIDQKNYTEAKACSSESSARLKGVNKRTVDVIALKLYFYYSLSYERTNNLAEIRSNLLALHHSETLRHDELGQEMLLNMLLRNYLHENLYDLADKLRSKTTRFEIHSNQQFCRYLFYMGKIQTIQLEYTDAKESLLQAARKAPVASLGFRVKCNKWAIIVRLLLGCKNWELFGNVHEKFAKIFAKEKTNNLIVRLRHNVIRTGLRNISMSYSRISLQDVALKLRLNSANPVADAESMVAKAIRDGAIDATIDHKNKCMVSKETGDIYSTNEPQTAFNSRIAFCLNMHNEAVRALRFPPNTYKEKESNEKRREKKHQEEELAKYLAEEDDHDF